MVVTLSAGSVIVSDEPLVAICPADDRFHGAFILRGCGCHLIHIGRAGKSLTMDRRDLGGGGAIDGHEDHTSRGSAVEAGVDHYILDTAGCGLQRNVAKARVPSIEAAIRTETRQR